MGQQKTLALIALTVFSATVLSVSALRLLLIIYRWVCGGALVLLRAVVTSGILTWAYSICCNKHEQNSWLDAFQQGSVDALSFATLCHDFVKTNILQCMWRVARMVIKGLATLLIPKCMWEGCSKVWADVTHLFVKAEVRIDDATGLPVAKLAMLKQMLRREIPVLQLEPRYTDLHKVVVQRQTCLSDSMRALPINIQGVPLWSKAVSIDFAGEAGVDASGLKREWVTVVARQIQAACLARTGNEAMEEFFIAPAGSSGTNTSYKELLDTYDWFGMLLAKMLLENNRAWYSPLQLRLPFQLAPIFYTMLMSKEPDHSDIQCFDPQNYKNIQSLASAEPGTVDAMCLTFTYYRRSRGGTPRPQPLRTGGSMMAVTDANKHEYVQLYMQEVKRGVMEQMDKVVEGFRRLIPDAVYQHLQTGFTASELKLLFEGYHRFNISDLQQAVRLEGYNADDSDIRWFWKSARNLTPDQQCSLLEFITGCRSMPVLQPGQNAFVIRRVRGSGQQQRGAHALPVAHTCSKTLDLAPGYKSQQQMERHLQIAIANRGQFGIA